METANNNVNVFFNESDTIDKDYFLQLVKESFPNLDLQDISNVIELIEINTLLRNPQLQFVI